MRAHIYTLTAYHGSVTAPLRFAVEVAFTATSGQPPLAPLRCAIQVSLHGSITAATAGSQSGFATAVSSAVGRRGCRRGSTGIGEPTAVRYTLAGGSTGIGEPTAVRYTLAGGTAGVGKPIAVR